MQFECMHERTLGLDMKKKLLQLLEDLIFHQSARGENKIEIQSLFNCNAIDNSSYLVNPSLVKQFIQNDNHQEREYPVESKIFNMAEFACSQ